MATLPIEQAGFLFRAFFTFILVLFGSFAYAKKQGWFGGGIYQQFGFAVLMAHLVIAAGFMVHIFVDSLTWITVLFVFMALTSISFLTGYEGIMGNIELKRSFGFVMKWGVIAIILFAAGNAIGQAMLTGNIISVQKDSPLAQAGFIFTPEILFAVVIAIVAAGVFYVLVVQN